MVKYIVIILSVVFVAVFAGFNLDNKCNIWLFHNFQNVPVFITALLAFVCGMLLAVPYAFFKKKTITEKDVAEFEKNKLKMAEKQRKAAEKKAKNEALLAERKANEEKKLKEEQQKNLEAKVKSENSESVDSSKTVFSDASVSDVSRDKPSKQKKSKENKSPGFSFFKKRKGGDENKIAEEKRQDAETEETTNFSQ